MDRVRLLKDQQIQYTEPGGVPLYLDIVRPEYAEQAPVILTVFGGGWCSGDRTTLGAASHRLAREGYVVVSVDYRLAPAHLYPTALDDLATAIRWIQCHAREYGGDALRLGGYGVSAGGHLVALLATRDATPFTCAVSWGGPMDLRATPVTEAYRAYPLAFLGACQHSAPELYTCASPICGLSPSMPPLLLIHGSNDAVVPIAQAERMIMAAEHCAAPVRLHIIDGAGHEPGDLRYPAMTVAWKQLIAFFMEHLQAQRVDSTATDR